MGILSKHRIFVLTVLLGVSALLVSCNRGGQDTKNAPAAPQETVFAVYTLEAVPGSITNYLRVNGDVKSNVNVDVLPDVAGKLVALKVSLGQNVLRGQVIAEVDPSRPGLEYVASPVKSPIDGTITALPFSVGATVAPSTPIARLGQLGEVTLTTQVAERYLAAMKLGLQAEIRLEAFPGEILPGRISEIAPVVDPLSRSVEVKIRPQRADSRLRPGMFAQIRILTENRQGVLRVPTEAVVRRFGESYVFVVQGDRAERRTVKVGLDVDGLAEIREGLRAGELVIVRGQTLLEDKSLIRVVRQLDSLPSGKEGE